MGFWSRVPTFGTLYPKDGTSYHEGQVRLLTSPLPTDYTFLYANPQPLGRGVPIPREMRRITRKVKDEICDKSPRFDGLCVWKEISEWCPPGHRLLAIVDHGGHFIYVEWLEDEKSLDGVLGHRGLWLGAWRQED